MTLADKLRHIEDALELEPDSISEDTILDDLVEYDSMGKLSLIVMCDDEFSKKLSGEQIKEFVTVGDIIAFLD